MSPRHEREAGMDDMLEYSERFAPIKIEPPAHPEVTVLPMHLAAAMVPRRNLCAEFMQLSTEELLAEAEGVKIRLDRAGRPTDYAVVHALTQRIRQSAPKLDSTLWLELSDKACTKANAEHHFEGVDRRHA